MSEHSTVSAKGAPQKHPFLNPPPGSKRAKELGCICPVLDNSYGSGYMGGVKKDGKIVYVWAPDCGLHGPVGDSYYGE